jgi:ankyrin repeat protein
MDMEWVAYATIPEDAEVKEFSTKIKTTSVILHAPFIPIIEFAKTAIQAGANVNDGYDSSNTALEIAVLRKDYHMVKLLLEAGADVHVHNDYPLRTAAQKGCTRIVDLLIQFGANVHVDDEIALKWAITLKRIKVVELLVKANANVHIHNEYPLMLTANYKYVNICHILLNAGANIHVACDSLRSRMQNSSADNLMEIYQNWLALKKK